MSARPLSADKLCPQLSPDRIPWKDSRAIPRRRHAVSPQPRALKALELALSIRAAGYNIYLSGSENLGRTFWIREYLTAKAKKWSTPNDLVYINNFTDTDHPILLTLPAGMGKRLRDAMSGAVASVRKQLPLRLEHASYVKRHGDLQKKFQDIRSSLIGDMDKMAGGQGFKLDMDEQGGLTLYPLIEGKRLNDDEYGNLDLKLRQKFRRKGSSLMQELSGLVKKLSDAEREFHADERGLERDTVTALLDEILSPERDKILKACPDNKLLSEYFEALYADIAENIELFLPHESPDPRAPQTNDDPYRYDINLFVSHGDTQGAPVIVEAHPTTANLLGCIERESEMGALITDFTLIKAGSLHRANGGFLIIRVEDILQHPNAWEGLMRTLRAGHAILDENQDSADGAIRTKGIAPEPVPLDLKIILVGNEIFYEQLLASDLRFGKLFKIKAQLTDFMARTATNIRSWVGELTRIIDADALLPFSREALAGLTDYASMLAEDSKKISLQFPIIRDVMIESDAVARANGEDVVSIGSIENALAARVYRTNLVEELYLEEYDRDMIKIKVTGSAVGRVNGLSVTDYGDFAFGLPHQISCTVGVGHDGIIDLEREAELGGPIHTKAMLILKSYLTSSFAREKPLVLTGSLCFEQNYAGIEGDSASGAELAALLSAISEVPIDLSYAFTGAVSQSGQILPVGGVTQKIKGFFSICMRRGLTGKQGVLLPADNIDHLMLPRNIRDAVAENKFHIIPVRHITEAMEILTGLPAGRPLKNSGFTQNSLYDLVDRRLRELGHLAEHAFDRTPRKRRG